MSITKKKSLHGIEFFFLNVQGIHFNLMEKVANPKMCNMFNMHNTVIHI